MVRDVLGQPDPVQKQLALCLECENTIRMCLIFKSYFFGRGWAVDKTCSYGPIPSGPCDAGTWAPAVQDTLWQHKRAGAAVVHF